MKHYAHNWHTPKFLRWCTYCRNCGLVALRNEATRRAIKASCPDGME